MAGEGKVPIGQTIQAGFAFARSSLPVTFPAAALVAVVATAAQALSAPGAAGETGPGSLLLPLTLVASVAYSAFLFRLAIHEDASGFFGLKLGMDEARLLGVACSVGFLIGVIGLVALLLLGIAAGMAAVQNGVDPKQLEGDPAQAQALMMAALKTPAGMLFWLLSAGAAILIVWVIIRLCLATPATIGERRMIAFSSFAWTKGNVLPIFAALMPVTLPQVAIGVWAGQFASTQPLQLLMGFALTLVQVALLTPAQAGAYAYLYKGLRPPSLSAKAF